MREVDFGNLHHAYLVVGEPTHVERGLHQVFAEQGLKLIGSPDFFAFKEETFGIEEARGLSALALRRAFGERKVFFLAPQTLTLEAQNALLKTFEEPIAHTHFFLVVPSLETVIPTLRSRMRVVRYHSTQALDSANKFLTGTLKERLNFTKRFIDKEENLTQFLDELLLLMREKSIGISYLTSVSEMRQLSRQRGASSRLILEHLSLVL
jgi:hypothetical protein